MRISGGRLLLEVGGERWAAATRGFCSSCDDGGGGGDDDDDEDAAAMAAAADALVSTTVVCGPPPITPLDIDSARLNSCSR